MVGFGPEDDHFVAELTYNYGIGDYKLGNDFMVNTILFQQVLAVPFIEITAAALGMNCCIDGFNDQFNDVFN